MFNIKAAIPAQYDFVLLNKLRIKIFNIFLKLNRKIRPHLFSTLQSGHASGRMLPSDLTKQFISGACISLCPHFEQSHFCQSGHLTVISVIAVVIF
jgi:hypothetical protein